MKAFVANSAVIVAFLAVLLVSAGRADYVPAWAYAAIGLLTNVAMRLVLARHPKLAAERARPGPGAVAWDKRLLGSGALLTLAMLIVAALDSGRFGWTPRAPWPVMACGVAASLSGTALFLAAMSANDFFSAVVRIQRDRGHAVCRRGPYAIVRHPGNAGMILGTLGFPLLFGSAWSTIPVALSVALMVVRTRLEDALLERELAGYRDYQRDVRWRLVPRLW